MNLVYSQRQILQEYNYVLKADAKSFYWFGVSKGLIDKYVSRFGDNFNIILYGDESKEGDFYVIPYYSIKDLLTEESIYLQKERMRWVGDVRNHLLRIRKTKVDRNISGFYSLPPSQGRAKGETAIEILNDYSIENAKREISIRLRQSKFRTGVLRNFDYKCCLTSVYEKDLLVASHIIPWSEKISTRLDPSNGLCLSVLYDGLFDKGYFTIDHELRVVVTSKMALLSTYVQMQLLAISGTKINSPRFYSINTDSIEFHNKAIFESYIELNNE